MVPPVPSSSSESLHDRPAPKTIATAHRAPEDAIHRQAEFLGALHETTLDLLGRNVPELLQALAGRATALLNSPQVEISLLEEGDLVLRASSRGGSPAGRRVRREDPAIAWRAIATCSPLLIEDFGEYPGSLDFPQPHGLCAAAIFPIVRGAGSIGVLAVAREDRGTPFTTEDVQQGILLAQMAALVLHNAQIHEEAVREAESRTTALRETEARFHAVFDQSPIAITLLSLPDGRIVELNSAAVAAFGYTREQAINRTTVELNLWVDEGLRDHYVAKLQADGTVAGFEAAMRRKNGEIFTALYSGTLLVIGGRLYGLNTLQDITERQKMEAQLRQTSKMESLGTLAGGIAHEFNNILTGTFGFVDLARMELPPAHPAQAWLDRIVSSSQRARDLVRQILTFSRRSEGHRVTLRLHLVAEEALRMLRTTIPRHVSLDARIDADTPPVLADAAQIQQAVLNLCTNAVNAVSDRGGRIAVTLESCELTAAEAARDPDLHPGRWVRLRVADDGSGIEPETIEHIFEPFYTTKVVGTASGLGLAVVHGIMKTHQGAVVVNSVVGAGSSFELYFPPVAVEAGPADSPGAPVQLGAGERILVVDDDTVSGFAIEKLIESLGYRVRRFVHPEDAMAHFAQDPTAYDLVITDLAMPVMDGAVLTAQVARIRPDLPVIVVTGYIERERLRLLERSAARVVLHKPVQRPELARAIARYLREKRK